MWNTLAEEQRQHFDRMCKFWGKDQLKMNDEPNELQVKQERLRTRWTPTLDKIFADIIVEQIQLGNRKKNVFDKKTWNHIREEFNRQTNLNFNNNQLRKHLSVLRTRYHNLQSACNQNDTVQDPSHIEFGLWDEIGVPSKIETAKMKESPIYEQLCVIFADSGGEGKYAQSSHYEELGKSVLVHPSAPEGGNPLPNGSFPHTISKNITDEKRKRRIETGQQIWNQDLGDAMAEAIMDMINSSRLKRVSKPLFDERFTISNCIKALDEIESVEDSLYYAALDLFETPDSRETFISLKTNQLRLTWLQGKCGNSNPEGN